MIIMFFSQKQQLSEHKQQSVLKCYTVTLHFKKEGMYNKYLKIQHLFWQVNKQENNHPFSPFFLQKWLPFEKGCEPFNLWDVPVSFCTINVTFSRKTNFANGFATLKILYPAVTYAAAQHKGHLFWITCQWLKLLRKASHLQVIQNLTPSTILRQ